MKRFTAIFTLTVFLFSSVFGETLHAAAGTMAEAGQFKQAFNDLLIPSACGRVTDTYIAPVPAGSGARRPLVINIQDLHCHAEVQRNIAKILSALDSKYGLNRVYVEGGYGTVDTSWLCGVGDKGLKKEIAEKLIDQGKLTGSELYSINAQRPDVLQGLEDRSLHQQNIVRLGKILDRKEYFETEIKGLERDLELMKAKYFTAKNRKFDDIVARHRKGELSSDRYYLLLTSYAETINRSPDKFHALLPIDTRDYPEIYNYVELIRLSKGLNYRRISRQLQEFMRMLKSRVPYNAYSTLLEKTDNFARTDELYLYLTEISGSPALRDLGRRYPDLYRFFEFTRKNRSINPVRLIEEEKRLVEEIRIGLSQDVSELEVAFLSDFFGYFQDYLLNRLSADDYAYFLERFEKFRKLWGKYAFRNRVAELEGDFPLLSEYFKVNNERNERFLLHIPELQTAGVGAGERPAGAGPLLSESALVPMVKDSTVIVMVTGGFHTEGLKKLFRERNISYLTVTPAVTGDADLSSRVYAEMAKKQARQFSVQALALALGSTDAKIVSVTKNEIVVLVGKDRVRLQRNKDTGKATFLQGIGGMNDPAKAHQIESAVNEALHIMGALLKLDRPEASSAFIYELVKVFSVGTAKEGIFGGNGLIWSIATDDKVLEIIEKRGGVSADELSQLPDIIQELIKAYSLQEEGQIERARGNALLSAILQVPDLQLYVASKAAKERSPREGNDARGALTARLSYAIGAWLFEGLWGKPLSADIAGRERITRASELLASFNPFDIFPLHLWEMATGVSKATPKRILGTTVILGATAAAWHLGLGIGMIYIIHSLTHLAYNLAVPGEPLTAGGGRGSGERLTRIKGYREYGETVSTYYRARRQLFEAIDNRDINAYTAAYDTFMRSARTVKEAYRNDEPAFQGLVEAMQKEGLLAHLSYKDARGNETTGSWNEILKIGGETFSEEHHRWIAESLDTMIQAFPKSQQKAVEAVREKIIKNTFAFSGERLIPSPDRIRQAMDQATGDADLQRIREFLLESLTGAAEFKFGFTLPYQAEPEIVMHPIKEEDWFRAIYMHETGHYLFRMGIVDLPQMEIITHAISSIWLKGRDYPELFAAGTAWAGKNPGREISVNELEQVSYEGVVTNWSALGFPSMETAMQVPLLVQSGQIKMEDYQRWVGAALGGALYRQAEQDRQLALQKTIVWADAVLAKETDNVTRFHPDIARRKKILAEVEELLQLITDKDIHLVEQQQKEGRKSVFSISQDRKSIYYVPELLDHPDEAVARALFFEQIFSLLYSEPGWVEPSYKNALFMSLFAIMEIGRTRNQGVKKYAGLKGTFLKLNQAFYPNVRSESAKRKMNNLPLIVQFLEASLYEGRMTLDGKSVRDPRVKNSAVRKVLRETAKARRKAIAAESTRESYLVVRDEIWPLLQKLIAMTEDQMKRQMERQEGKPQAEQKKAAGGQGMDDAVKEMLQQALQQLLGDTKGQRQDKRQGKSGEGMEGGNGTPGSEQENGTMQEGGTPGSGGKEGHAGGEQQARAGASAGAGNARQGGTGAVNEAVRRALQDMLEEMAGSNPQVASAQQQLQSEQRQATQQTMEEAVESAQRQLDAMNRNLDALADRVGEAKGQSDHLGTEAGRLRDQTGTEPITKNDVQKLEDIVSQIDEQAGQLAGNGRALKDDATDIRQNSTKMDENIAPSANGLKDSSRDLDTKVNRINDAIAELNKKVDELKSRLRGLQQTVEQHRDTPTQRTGVSNVQDRNEEIAGSLDGIKELTGTVQNSLGKVMDDVRKVGKEIEELNKKVAGTETSPEAGSEENGGANGEEKTAGEQEQQGEKEGKTQQQVNRHTEEGEANPNFANPTPSAVNQSTRRLMEKLRERQRLDSSGIDVSKRRSGDKAADTFSREKGTLSPADRAKMKKLLDPGRPTALVLNALIKRNLQETQLGRDMRSLTEGDLDDQNLPVYKLGRSFKRELLPGRVNHRIMFVVFNTCSQCRVRDPNSSIAHAYKALLVNLLALEGIPGVEVGVMMYGESSGERLLLPLTKASELTDEDIYRMDKPLCATCGSASDIATLDEAAELIARDADPDALKTIVHFGDGNPGDRSLHSKVMKLYAKHARSDIQWASFGVGPKTRKGREEEYNLPGYKEQYHNPQKIEIDYAADQETARLFPSGLTPVVGWIPDANDFGRTASDFVEKIFKTQRPVSALGERVQDVFRAAVYSSLPEAMSLLVEFILDKSSAPFMSGLPKTENIPVEQLRRSLVVALSESAEMARSFLLLLLKGEGGKWLMRDEEVQKRFGAILKYVNMPKEGGQIRVSTAPLDLMAPRRDAYAFATIEEDHALGRFTMLLHESFLDTLMRTGPPESFTPAGDPTAPDAAARAKAEFIELLFRHEAGENHFIALVIEALAADNFTALQKAYPKLSSRDIAFLRSHPNEAYEVFHKLTEKEYASLFEFAQTIVASNEDLVYMGYIRKNGKTYLRFMTPEMVEPLEIEVEPRDDNRVVKLFVKKAGEWVRLRPGIDLTTIPDEIAYSLSYRDVDPSTFNENNYFTFNRSNLATLAEMLKIYSNPNAKNSNLGMVGPKGAGKNTMEYIMLGLLGAPRRMMSLHAHTTQTELRERPVITTQFKPVTLKNKATGEEVEYLMPASSVEILLSEAYDAARLGETVVFDETDKLVLPGNLSGLNPLLTRQDEGLEGMDGIDPRFRAIANRNTHEGEDVHGQDLTTTAADFVSRFKWVSVGYMDQDSELDYVMRTVFRDLPRDTAQERADYEDRKVAMELVITLANEIRKAAKEGKVPSTMSPRAVIAIARHLKYYFNDLTYFRSVFEKAYNTELMETGKKVIDDAFKLVGLPNDTFPEDFDQVGNTFGYEVKDGRVYATLGEDEWKVRVLTGYRPDQIEWVKKEKLRDEFHIKQNMMLFWQLMKDKALGNRIMILGVPGTGKTELASYLLNDVLGLRANYQVLTTATRGDDLLGRWRMKDDTMVFEPSKLVSSMQEGRPVIVDEIDKPRDDTSLSATNNIGQFGQVNLPDRSVVEAIPGFFEFYLGNLANKGGTSSNKISGEVLDRSSVYVMKPLSAAQTVEILERYVSKRGFKIDRQFIEALVKVHFYLGKKADEERVLPSIPSMRTLEGVIDYLGHHSEGYLDPAEIYLQGYSLEHEIHKDIVRKAFHANLGIEYTPGVNASASFIALVSGARAIARAKGYALEDRRAEQLVELSDAIDQAMQDEELPNTLNKTGFIKLVKTVAGKKGSLLWQEGAGIRTIADTVIASLESDGGRKLLDSHKELIRRKVREIFPEIGNKAAALDNLEKMKKLQVLLEAAFAKVKASGQLTQDEKDGMIKSFNDGYARLKDAIKDKKKIMEGSVDEKFLMEQATILIEAQKMLEDVEKRLSDMESTKQQRAGTDGLLADIREKQGKHVSRLSGPFAASMQQKVDELADGFEKDIAGKIKAMQDKGSLRESDRTSLQRLTEEARTRHATIMSLLELAEEGDSAMEKAITTSEDPDVVRAILSVLGDNAGAIRSEEMILALIEAAKTDRFGNEAAGILRQVKLPSSDRITQAVAELIRLKKLDGQLLKNLTGEQSDVAGKVLEEQLQALLSYLEANRNDDGKDFRLKDLLEKYLTVMNLLQNADRNVFTQKHVELLMKIYLAGLAARGLHDKGVLQLLRGISIAFERIAEDNDALIKDDYLFVFLSEFSTMTSRWYDDEYLNKKFFQDAGNEESFKHMLAGLLVKRSFSTDTTEQLFQLVKTWFEHADRASLNRWLLPVWEESVAQRAWNTRAFSRITREQGNGTRTASEGWERVFSLITVHQPELLKMSGAFTSTELKTQLTTLQIADDTRRKEIESIVRAAPVDIFTEDVVPELVGAVKRNAAIRDFVKKLPARGANEAFMKTMMATLLVEALKGNDNAKKAIQSLRGREPGIFTALINDTIKAVNNNLATDGGYKGALQAWDKAETALKILDPDFEYHDIVSLHRLEDLYFAHIVSGYDPRDGDSEKVALKIAEYLSRLAHRRADIIDSDAAAIFLESFHAFDRSEEYMKTKFLQSDGHREAFGIIIDALSAGKEYANNDIRDFSDWVNEYGQDWNWDTADRIRALNHWLLPLWKNALRKPGQIDLIKETYALDKPENASLLAAWEEVFAEVRKNWNEKPEATGSGAGSLDKASLIEVLKKVVPAADDAIRQAVAGHIAASIADKFTADIITALVETGTLHEAIKKQVGTVISSPSIDTISQALAEHVMAVHELNVQRSLLDNELSALLQYLKDNRSTAGGKDFDYADLNKRWQKVSGIMLDADFGTGGKKDVFSRKQVELLLDIYRYSLYAGLRPDTPHNADTLIGISDWFEDIARQRPTLIQDRDLNRLLDGLTGGMMDWSDSYTYGTLLPDKRLMLSFQRMVEGTLEHRTLTAKNVGATIQYVLLRQPEGWLNLNRWLMPLWEKTVKSKAWNGESIKRITAAQEDGTLKPRQGWDEVLALVRNEQPELFRPAGNAAGSAGSVTAEINAKLDQMIEFAEMKHGGEEIGDEWEEVKTELTGLDSAFEHYDRDSMKKLTGLYFQYLEHSYDLHTGDARAFMKDLGAFIKSFAGSKTGSGLIHDDDLIVFLKAFAATTAQWDEVYSGAHFFVDPDQKKAFGDIVDALSAQAGYPDAAAVKAVTDWVRNYAHWKKLSLLSLNEWLMPAWKNIADKGQAERNALLGDIAVRGSKNTWKANEGWKEVVTLILLAESGLSSAVRMMIGLLEELQTTTDVRRVQELEKSIKAAPVDVFTADVIPEFVKAIEDNAAMRELAVSLPGKGMKGEALEELLNQLYAEARDGNGEAKTTFIALREHASSAVTSSLNKRLSEMVSTAKRSDSATVKDAMTELKDWLNFWDPEFAYHDRTSLEHLVALYSVSFTYGEYRYDPIQEFAKDVANYLNRLAKARPELVQQDDLRIRLLQDFELMSAGWSGGYNYVFSEFMPKHQAAFRDAADALSTGRKYTGDDIAGLQKWVINFSRSGRIIVDVERLRMINQWLMPAWKNIAASGQKDILLSYIASRVRGADGVWKANEGWEEVVAAVNDVQKIGDELQTVLTYMKSNRGKEAFDYIDMADMWEKTRGELEGIAGKDRDVYTREHMALLQEIYIAAIAAGRNPGSGDNIPTLISISEFFREIAGHQKELITNKDLGAFLKAFKSTAVQRDDLSTILGKEAIENSFKNMINGLMTNVYFGESTTGALIAFVEGFGEARRSAVNRWLMPLWDKTIENDAWNWKLRQEIIEEQVDGGTIVPKPGWKGVYTLVNRAKTSGGKAILPGNLQAVNRWANEGKGALNIAFRIALKEFVLSAFYSEDYITAHKGPKGAEKVVKAGARGMLLGDFIGTIAGPTIAAVFFGIASPLLPMLIGALVGAAAGLFAANVGAHTSLDYHYLKGSGLTDAVGKFGAAIIDENGAVHTNIYIMDKRTENMDRWGWKNTGINIDGKPLWASTKAGAVVLFAGDGDGREIPSEVNSLLTGKGRIAAGRRAVERFKGFFRSVNVDLEAQGFRAGIIIDHTATDDRIRYENGSMVVSAKFFGDLSAADAPDVIAAKLGELMTIREAESVAMPQDIYIRLDNVERFEEFMTSLEAFNRAGSRQMIIDPAVFEEKRLSFEELKDVAELARKSGTIISLDLTKDGSKKELYLKAGFTKFTVTTGSGTRMVDPVSDLDMEAAVISGYSDVRELRDKMIASKEVIKILNLSELEGLIKGEQRDIIDRVALTEILRTTILSLYSVNTLSEEYVRNVGYAWNRDKLPVPADDAKLAALAGTVADGGSTVEQIVQAMGIKEGSSAVAVYLAKLQAEVTGTGREAELPQLQKAFLTAITEKMLARARLDAEEKFDGLADNELEIILGQKLLRQIVKKAGAAKPSLTADEFKKQNGSDKTAVFFSKLNLKIRELSTDDSPDAISAVIELIAQLAERKVRFDQGKKALMFDPKSVAAVLKAA